MTRDSGARCGACGAPIDFSRNDYRVIGLRVDPAWRDPAARPDPPQSIYWHRGCRAAAERKNDARPANATGADMPRTTMLQGLGA